MIRRIQKTGTLILLAATVSTLIPCGVIRAGAVEKSNESVLSEGIINESSNKNIETLINKSRLADENEVTDEQIAAIITSYLSKQYAEGSTINVEKPVSIGVEITKSEAAQIANKLCSNDDFVKKMLIKKGYTEEAINGMSKEQFEYARKQAAGELEKSILSIAGEKVPVYHFTVSKDGKIIDKGFFVGGKLGAAIMQSNDGKPIYVSGKEMDELNSAVKDKIISKIKDSIGKLVGTIIENTGIGSVVDDVTDTFEDLADAIDDLADSIKDKADDIDDAWDKVFDRFDNDEGWGRRDGYTYYYDKDGISLKGVQKIDGKTYYFNRIDGAMETGWQIVDGKRCYFDEKRGYQVFLQWVKDGDDWYFLSNEGPVKKSEWVNDGGKKYYLKSDGKMTKGWLKIDDYWYYFNESTGAMETSKWKYSQDKWYYLNQDGKAANDWTYINGNWYYFRESSAAMETGWFRADGSWYYADSSGAMKTGWVWSDDGWYYMDDISGKMKKNEWVYNNGSWYYFNINGVMVTKSRYIDGVKYNFNSDGRMV